MPNAQRDVVKPPNLAEFSSNRAANGFSPLTHGMSPITHHNLPRGSDGRAGSSGSLAREKPDIPETNHRFDVDNVGNSQIDNFPVQPGQGRRARQPVPRERAGPGAGSPDRGHGSEEMSGEWGVEREIESGRFPQSPLL